MLFYSLNWTKKKGSFSKNLNRTTIQIEGVKANGQRISVEKVYDEWLAACTNNIDKIITQINFFFPGINLTYELLNNKQYKKVLPNFAKTLLQRKENRGKNVYKLYSNNAYINDVGVVMNVYKLSYYQPEDWLIRLFIDLCLDDTSFYYRWYNVGSSTMLLESMQFNREYREYPDIHIVAFDLKTVSTDNANRFPTGHDEHDKIVMISLVKWNYRYEKTEKLLLYLNPLSDSVHDRFQKLPPDVKYLEFFDEKELLKTFHATLSQCHILTGYNINNFNLPCLLARVVLLNMTNELKMYSSKRIGTHIITTVENRMVLDMYDFIQLFSKQDLTSYELSDVVKCKLNRSGYHRVKTTNSLHFYYYSDLIKTTDILLSSDKKYLYDYLKPNSLDISEFGTYLDCLNCCMENSILIYLLFKHELALTFLIERANATALDMESGFYLSNSKYILSMFLTAGIRLRYFMNIHYFQNSVEKDLVKYRKFLVRRKNNSYTYQGGLNFGIPGTFYKNVTVLDFLSMYSSIVVNQNLSYETCGLIDTDTFLNLSDDIKEMCIAVPYSQHSENEILLGNYFHSSLYELPKMNVQKDELLMVSLKNEMGFLPSIMNEFLEKRKDIQKQYKENKSITLYVRQLNIKIFLNAISGCLGSETFPMGYVDVPMIITCYARIFLLSASHFAQHVLGCKTVYSDTDSIFLLDYAHNNCDLINRYLNQKWIVLQMEKSLSSLLILSKKKYIFREKNRTDCKLVGFEKKANGISKWMSYYIASEVLSAMIRNERSASHGWVIWTNALIRAFVMSSNSKAFYLTQKTKKLHPQLADNTSNKKYTYCRADVSKLASEKMIITHETDCKEVNFEKLFQKNLLIRLLNVAFFNLHCPTTPCNKVLNTMKWKGFVNADLTCLRKFKKPILILVLKSVKYTFEINECLSN